jgi:hypothetical protein
VTYKPLRMVPSSWYDNGISEVLYVCINQQIMFCVINFSVEIQSNLRNLLTNKIITNHTINHYILIKIHKLFCLLILLHYSLPSFLALFLEVLQTSIYFDWLSWSKGRAYNLYSHLHRDISYLV